MTTGSLALSAPRRSGPLLGTAWTVGVWVMWHVLSAVFIPLALSELRLRTPLWQMSFQVRAFLVSLVVTHLAAAFLLSWLAVRRGAVGLLAVLVSVALPYAILFLGLQFYGIGYSRSVFVMAVGGSFVLGSLSLDLMERLYRVLLPALLLASAGMASVAFAGWPADDGVRATTFYRVKLVESGLVVPSEVRGGALEVLGTGLLVASGDGSLYYVEGTGVPGSAVRRLRYDIPLNLNGYKADRPDNIYGNDPFRVADILVENLGDRFRLFASHHYWKSEDRCVGMRVSVTEAPRAAFLSGTAEVAWRTLYDSQPCLKLVEIRFVQSGGIMVKLDDRSLLVTVGDHNLDGFYAKASVPQDPNSHYGKTIRIDLESGASEVYTLGHRNALGLHKASDGRLWLTEQGPAGGDELNLVKQGSNYGWPRVTYGTAYDQHTWPPSLRDGYHAGYVEPFFAWVPSIAVTSILSIQQDLFPAWKGDLMVASLKGYVIRLRVADDRVVFAEPIYSTNTRIRDMAEAQGGQLVLLQDDGSISFIEGVPVAGGPAIQAGGVEPHRGEALFRACQDCHRIGSGSDHGAGPDLRGIIGRDIASAPGFEYSAGLTTLTGSWTEERLNRFLENPEGFVPGTSMQTEGIEDATTRRLLIDYLGTSNQVIR